MSKTPSHYYELVTHELDEYQLYSEMITWGIFSTYEMAIEAKKIIEKREVNPQIIERQFTTIEDVMKFPA